MSTVTLTRPAQTPVVEIPVPAVRPARRAMPSRGPVARPVRGRSGPTRRARARVVGRSCQFAAAPTGSWRLTDRGIALVLVLGAMIAVAAVAVIGLTAWQVTGADVADGAAALVSSR